MTPTGGPHDFDGLRDKVVELLCLGHTQSAIAATLGISVNAVSRIRESEFKERFAAREELKRRTALELDWLARPLKERYAKKKKEGGESREDALTILKIIDRRCKLFALDEPVRLEIKHVEQLSDEQLAVELKKHGVEVRQLEQHKPEATTADQIPDADFEPVPEQRPTAPPGSSD